MAGVFISYRRSDTAGWAGRVADHLKSAFGDERVFIDVSDIDPGDDFEDAIGAMLDRVDAVVVMIGPEWTTVEDDHGPRLVRPDDQVRREVADALRSGVRVLPVLVDGASMPDADQLPEDLRPLTKKNAVSVSGTGFRSDLDQIVRILRRELPWYARPPRQLAMAAGGLAVLSIAALVGLAVVLSGSDEPSSGDVLAAADPGGEDAADDSTTTSSSTSTSSTTEPRTSAIAVTSRMVGTQMGMRWVVPDESLDDASTMLRDGLTDFDAFALAQGWAATSSGSVDEGPLAVQAIVQGTPRLAGENLSVAIVGFRIEVLEAAAPASGAIGGIVSAVGACCPPPPRIEASVTLPALVDDPFPIDLEVDGEPVTTLESFSLGAGDTTFIMIEVDATKCTCTWQGELDVLIAGEPHTYPIVDESGAPFIMSGSANVSGFVEPAPPES